MKIQKIRTCLTQNWFFYGITCMVLFGLKYFYSRASAPMLTWLLAPTVWWVRALGGIPFVYDPCDGYVSHTYRFVIAPSCSGMQFMIITIATLIFSFIHLMNTGRKKLGWMTLSLTASYGMTILVNVLRILISIYLPLYLEGRCKSCFLTPERLHTLIGVGVYFASLLIIYQLAGLLTRRPFRKCLPPVIFYFGMVLGIPFFRRAFLYDKKQFAEYALLVTCMCGGILVLRYIAAKIIMRSCSHKKPASGTTQNAATLADIAKKKTELQN